jgi:hypothetical protein
MMLLSTGSVRAQCTTPTSTIVNNTNCTTPNGKITFTAPTPTANYLYSIDGGITFGAPGQTVFTGLFGGTYPTVSKLISTGCVSPVTNKVITNPAAPANPTSTIVNNTNCNTPNGSITFTAPAPVANYQFSIDAGSTFGAPGVVLFNGLSAGSYPTVVKSVTTTCASGIATKVIANPAIAAPVSAVTAATNCNTPNGIITFTAQAGFVFSIDNGVNFGTAGQTVFNGLTPGTYVTRSRQTSTGCVSAAANKVIASPVVTAPTSTVVNVTNCNTPNGKITFSAPTPLANYQFSVDGGVTFGTAGQVIFSGLSAGTHQTQAKLVSTGCVSAKVAKAITNPAVVAPTSAVLNVTNCNTPNGRITFSAPTPLTSYQFSVNGGTTFGTTGQVIFNGLSAGSYATRVKLVSTGCMSPSAAKVIANPVVAAPTSTVTTSSCSSGTGTITFTAPTPTTSYSFSVDGGATFGTLGQTLFTGLTAGTYVTKTRSNVGCISATSTNKVITNTVTTAPTTLTGSNPTNCNTPNGSITFTAPTPLANYQFSVDGGTTYGTAGTATFSNLAGGTYVTKAKSVLTGCASANVNKVLTNPVVTVPTAAKTNVTDCDTVDGTITFSAPTPFGNFQYSVDGGNTFGITGQVFFPNLASGTYSPVAKLVSTGCESNPAANLIITKPAQAGSNKFICEFQPAIMNATALAGASWTAMAGNPMATTIVTPTSATTRINGFTTAGVYYYIWANASCSDTISVTVDDCLSPIVNNTGAFLYQNISGSGTDIVAVDIGTGAQDTLYTDVNSPNAGNINGVGFNVTDGEVWGSVVNGTGLATTGDSLARIGEDGIPHYFFVPGLYSGGYNVGTVDNDGVLYLYSSNQTQIFRVDINPTSPTFLTLLAPVLTTTAMSVADWAYNPIDGLIYGVGTLAGPPVTHPLYRVNPNTGAAVTVGNVTGDATFMAGGFGAAYMDASGNLYVGDNTAGGVYKINAVQDVTGNTTAALRSQGQPSNGNDGAMNHNACIKPDAGADMMICISGSGATMTATQVSGVAWEAQSDNPGTATITNPALATTTITNFSAQGTYHFIWSNGPDCNDTVAVQVINCATDTLVVPACDTCGTTICGTPNPDLPVNDSTVFGTCGLSSADSAYGTISIDANGCLLWSPNGTQLAGDSVATCVTSCNGTVCDTTYIFIVPPSDPLPVTLVYFKGYIDRCQANLNWRTTDEKLKDFTLERSIPGKPWRSIVTVPAIGNGFGYQDYGYVDVETPTGKSLYRLKMSDIDGKYRYSTIVSVNNDCQEAVISIFPNPSSEQQGIHLKINTLEKVGYQVFDQTGKLVRSGEFNSQVEIKGLKPGVYFVKAYSATVNSNQKIIIR